MEQRMTKLTAEYAHKVARERRARQENPLGPGIVPSGNLEQAVQGGAPADLPPIPGTQNKNAMAGLPPTFAASGSNGSKLEEWRPQPRPRATCSVAARLSTDCRLGVIGWRAFRF